MFDRGLGSDPPTQRANRWLPSTLLFGPALCWSIAALVAVVWTLADADAWTVVDRHGDPVAGSDSCRSCHPEQWRTWHTSWHRTMTQAVAVGPLEVATQAASPTELLAPFAGETLDYAGFRATMDRDADGQPRVSVIPLDDEGQPDGAAVLDASVALSVGSHRYQQYVAFLDRGGGSQELWRLPVAWHRDEHRWIHMNGAFVEPEGELGSLPDYERHLSRWNDNCIFCHNTEASPGIDLVAGVTNPEVESRVGELGIACEACHGPADAHVERHRSNPVRRLLGGPALDGSITNPRTLDPAHESAICGRCHGQRIARNIATVMREGDGFVPGDALTEVSRPIFRTTTIPGAPGLDEGEPFSSRFWPDGTPRLSAYEYQGLLASPCYADGAEGGLGCGHCHDMHGDDPNGQLRAGRTGQGACVDCHADQLGGGGGGSDRRHGGHDPAVDCLACHMPEISYGLLEGMITHRISSPDPGAWIGRQDQPDACTQCHVDRSRAWAAAAMPELGLHGSPASAEPLEQERLASRVVLDLLGGDPLQRNLAAHALASANATGPVDERLAWLADGLEDEYPSVRWFAWRGMRALAERSGATSLSADLAGFDYLGPIAERVVVVSRIRAQLGPPALVEYPQLRERLFEQREGLAIWIGE